MHIRITAASGAPIYLQIIRAVKRDIALGRLLPDEVLPSVRQLAVDLSVNPNTIAQAYRELEQEGFVYTRHGHGTFVARQHRGKVQAERRKAIASHIEEALIEGINMGLTESELRLIFRQVLGRLLATRNRREAALSRA